VPAFDTQFDRLSSSGGSSVQASVRPAFALIAKRMSRQELAEALALTARGDRAAFERVYASTSAKLYGVVVRILGRRDVAEDVLQDVYVRVWQHASDFDPASGSPITWMATIARNRALDEVKRKTIVRSFDDCPEVLEVGSGDDPGADQERNEERRRLLMCLNALEPEKRRVVLLAYFYGMTRAEIARDADRPVATVKTWLRRSLAQMKGCLCQ
jgi:RNA polymerase sigma-70 factor (ECF subfamily)